MRPESCGPPAAEACLGPDSPLHPLARLSVLVHGVVTEVAERNGLTPMQARMLGVLVAAPRRMAELGAALGVEKAALTGLVDRAVARSLVERVPVLGDRRAIQVAATEAGVAASAAFYGQLDEAMEGLIAKLPAPERDRYRAATEALLAPID